MLLTSLSPLSADNGQACAAFQQETCAGGNGGFGGSGGLGGLGGGGSGGNGGLGGLGGGDGSGGEGGGFGGGIGDGGGGLGGGGDGGSGGARPLMKSLVLQMYCGPQRLHDNWSLLCMLPGSCRLTVPKKQLAV